MGIKIGKSMGSVGTTSIIVREKGDSAFVTYTNLIWSSLSNKHGEWCKILNLYGSSFSNLFTSLKHPSWIQSLTPIVLELEEIF